MNDSPDSPDYLLGHHGGVPGVPINVRSAEDRCDITDLIKTNCAHCHPKRGNAFLAQFSGECPVCSGPIRPGSRIREAEDGTYVHAGHR